MTLKGYGTFAYAPISSVGWVPQVIAENLIEWAAIPDRHVALDLDPTAQVMMSLGGIGTQTLTLIPQGANEMLAGPETGADAAPDFRKLVAADLPVHGHTGVGDGGMLANVLMTGYLGVGIAMAPANTTAGDITGGRLILGIDGAMSATNYLVQTVHTFTDTSAGAKSLETRTSYFNPGGGSSSEFRSWLYQHINASNQNLNIVEGLWTEYRHRSSGTVASSVMYVAYPYVIDSSSPAAVGTVTWAIGFKSTPLLRSTANPTGTLSNVASFYAAAPSGGLGTGPLVMSNQFGLYIEALTLAASNWDIYHAGTTPMIGIGAGGTLTWRDPSKNILMTLADLGTTGQLSVTGNIVVPATTATDGIIYSGANRYIHSFGTSNFFAGVTAGNLTMSGNSNTGLGLNALKALTTGSNNVAIGTNAAQALQDGQKNVALGRVALYTATSGSNNMAIGQEALYYLTTGSSNVGIGDRALYRNVDGGMNMGIGELALGQNTSGGRNTAVGRLAGGSNTTGSQNVAIGENALGNDGNVANTASINVAIGADAMKVNTTGTKNVGIGRMALYANLGGSENIAIGESALLGNTSGNYNVAVGGLSGNGNTTGTYLTFLGYKAGQTSTDGLTKAGAIGYNAQVTASNSLVLGGTGADLIKVGIGVTAPTNDLSLSGQLAKTLWMERHTTANTAGNTLSVLAGGATSGATDKAGGDLILGPGLSTGSGESGVQIKGSPAGGAGTGDNALAVMLQVLGNKIGLFGVTPVVRPTALTTQLTTVTASAPGTPDYAIADLVAGGYGFVAADEGQTVLSVIANLQTRCAELETKLKALGALT